MCVLTTLFLLYDYIRLLEHIMSLSNEFDASSDMDFKLSCIIVALTHCACACVCSCVGVGVVVMNDWSHSRHTRTDTECTVSSRPVADLSPEV